MGLLDGSAGLLFKIEADASQFERETRAVDASVGALGGRMSSLTGIATVAGALADARLTAVLEASELVHRSLVEGRVLWDQALPGMDNAGRAAIYDEMNRVIAALHSVDVNAVGLAGLGARLPQTLSGGQLQRVAIARALVHRPALLLADEPTGNLDFETGDHIIELLFALNREQDTTLILVTHDDILADRCERVYRLADGKLTETGRALA